MRTTNQALRILQSSPAPVTSAFLKESLGISNETRISDIIARLKLDLRNGSIKIGRDSKREVTYLWSADNTKENQKVDSGITFKLPSDLFRGWGGAPSLGREL